MKPLAPIRNSAGCTPASATLPASALRREVLRTLAVAPVGVGLCLAGTCTPRLTWAQPQGQALPSTMPEWLGELPLAQRMGRGSYRWFGLAIYDIELWAPPGFEANRYASHAFALTLTYARALEGRAIAERSIAEMRRLTSFDASREPHWLGLMRTAFPDLKPKDRLTGLHDGKGGVQFWYNGRRRSQFQDPEFARLFFGIWLAEATSAPDLRQRLLEARNG